MRRTSLCQNQSKGVAVAISPARPGMRRGRLVTGRPCLHGAHLRDACGDESLGWMVAMWEGERG